MSRVSAGRGRYPTAKRRVALPPAIVAVIVLLAGVALVDDGAFVFIRYGVAILALIVAVFAGQGRLWPWVIAMAILAVLWNPVLPLPFGGDAWLAGQYVAALVFIAAGVLVRVDQEDGRA